MATRTRLNAIISTMIIMPLEKAAIVKIQGKEEESSPTSGIVEDGLASELSDVVDSLVREELVSVVVSVDVLVVVFVVVQAEEFSPR